MKRDVKRFTGRLASAEAVFIAILFLFLPSSASMLCIAPGSHIAIEDINAECCDSVCLAAPVEEQVHDRLSVPNICGNCTDLYIFLNGREAIPKSHINTASMRQVEFLGNQLPADPILSLFWQNIVCDINTANTASSSVPLRC
jgi:hypothetical protein